MSNHCCVSAFLRNLNRIYGIREDAPASRSSESNGKETECEQFLYNLSRIYGYHAE